MNDFTMLFVPFKVKAPINQSDQITEEQLPLVIQELKNNFDAAINNLKNKFPNLTFTYEL